LVALPKDSLRKNKYFVVSSRHTSIEDQLQNQKPLKTVLRYPSSFWIQFCPDKRYTFQGRSRHLECFVDPYAGERRLTCSTLAHSSDPKFDLLIKYVLTSLSNEIGIIGWDTPTSHPLKLGVTAPIKKEDLVFEINRESERVLATTFKGTRRFRILDEPWMDPTESFFIANVEILDGHAEARLPPKYQDQIDQLHHTIPTLLDYWLETVIEAGRLSPAGVVQILKQIGPMPSNPRDRALWVAALVNPTTTAGLCQEIRPSMLFCQNDFDRIVLVCAALKSSIKKARNDGRQWG
jgi:hypothetical protein